MALMCAVVSQFPITMDHLQKIGAMGISVFYSLVPPPPNHLLNRRPWTQVIALQDCKTNVTEFLQIHLLENSFCLPESWDCLQK
ncbi:hypothetical protein SDJN03_11172, partial [Cucurbita argyrosperma subsp. sororia]